MLYTKLSLIEKESKDVVVEMEKLEDVLPCGVKCLFMKLFIKKYFNKESFKGRMRKVWQAVMGVRFQDLSPVLFLVEFEDCRDKDGVLIMGF